MANINKQNFLFFNKKGDNMNFYWDPVDEIYKGNYIITDKESVSVDLIESEQIIVLEKVVDQEDGSFQYVKPLTQVDNSSLEFQLSDDSEEFFFYDIARGDDGFYYINKVTEQEVALTYDATFTDTTIGSKVYTQVPTAYDINSLKKNFTTVNIGFSASKPNSYIGKLIININQNGTVSQLAEIFFFGDVIGEDSRLPLLLNTLGAKLNNKDFIIFDKTNVKESEIDFNIINKKRKELLLEFHNIFPYLGGYKALINIIKFFGYENLTVKEYWKNVDINNEKYGYYKGVNIENIFKYGDTSTGEDLFPSKIYRKTNKFGLYYQITKESGRFDEDGIPIIEETSEFTVQEVLIKLFALKEKLKNYFLPFNAKIIDIVGEALYYNKIELNYWRDLSRIDAVDVNIDTTFNITPSNFGFIQDLRPLYWIGTKIGNDLKLNGTTNLKVREFTLLNSFYDNKLKIYDAVTGIGAEITAYYKSDNTDNMKRLYNELIQINQYPFTRYYITLNDNKILFVEKESTTSNIVSYVEQGRYAASPPTLNYVDFFNGSNAVSNFGEAYLGYFFDPDWSIFDLDNNEGIPVGYPVYLRNTSFDITWDEMQVTWDSLDNYNTYRDFNLPTDSGFPTLQWNSGQDQTSGVSWDQAGQSNFYEIEWAVYKEADDTPAFSSTVRGTIDEYNEYFVVLPYPGKYTVDLKLYDLYGSYSRRIKKDFITVEQKNPDFTAWKIADRFEATWNDLKETTWDQAGYIWDLPVKNPTTWDTSQIPWYSIDNVEFYQNLAKQDVEQNSLEDRNPYVWNNIPDDITWDDMDHLFWDELSPTFTKFYIKNLGATGTLTVVDANNNRTETWSWVATGASTNLYIDFVNEITKLDPSTYPILTSFLWDYTRVRNPQQNEIDTIIAVSKEYEKPKRYFFDQSVGMDVSPYNTPLQGYGALGDAPCGFSIFEIGAVGATGDAKLSIDGVVYPISPGVNDLATLKDDLDNNSPFTDDWEFNIVNVAVGATGATSYDMKIIAYKKDYIPNDTCNVLYKGMLGTRYGRSITTNATWSTLDVLYYQRDVKRATQVFFTYDISKMPGYTNPRWEIINENTGESVIKYLNKYMSYLFNKPGEYSVKLTLDDTNGNTKTIQKNGLIRVNG